MKYLFGLVGCVLVLSLPAHAAAQCLIQAGMHCHGCQSETYIQLRKGTVCNGQLNPSGQFHSTAITRKPALGEAKFRDLTRWAYRSFRAGQDSFQYKIEGTNPAGSRYTTYVTVHATVTD